MQKTFQTSVLPRMPMFKTNPQLLEQFFIEYKENAKVKFRKTRSLQINDTMVKAAKAYQDNEITWDQYFDIVGIKKSLSKGVDDPIASQNRADTHAFNVIKKSKMRVE